MSNYQYSYFIGALIFAAAWIVLYIFGKKYRRQMIWGSLLSAPFALTGFLFIPQYWNPPSLFDLDHRFGISIEDVLWSAAVGGIATVVAEELFKERLVGIRRKQVHRHYLPLIVIAIAFVALEVIKPTTSMYNMIAAFLAGAITIAFLRRDLIHYMLGGAVVFALCYLLLFAYFLILYHEFVPRFYNSGNLLGIYIFGVPIEEIIFALSGGAVWCVMYEYVHGYGLASINPIRFQQVEA